MARDKTLDLIVKCLELVASEADGEALAAARRANALRGRLGLSWREAIVAAGRDAGHEDIGEPAPPSNRWAGLLWAQERLKLLDRIAKLERDLADARMANADLESETAGARAFAAELEYLLSAEHELARQASERIGLLELALAAAERRAGAAEAELAGTELRPAALDGDEAESEDAEQAWRRGSTPLPLVIEGGRCVVLEIKPLDRIFAYPTLRRAEAALSHARRMGADYVLSSPNGVSLNTLRGLVVPPAMRAVLHDAIDAVGALDHAGYLSLRAEHGFKTIHLAALVLQDDLQFSRAPWRLSRLPAGETYQPLRAALAGLNG